ncbi:hypothetical protein CYY_005176 [Polysphondylium violaceum]|uniref:Single domain-containing protein n=1 Tax=Polysphondylium violaceum TaxID=133409 RepID=A0A8J4PV36_9MYCE|nr:hypothetical protein CYY_005176 [Polysphondylium violaceum]
MKSAILILSIIISIIFAVSSVSASQNFECSFTCTDGTKSILPFISSEEDCKLAVYYSECPIRKTPTEQVYCIPWCYPCNQCPLMGSNKIESFSFLNISTSC